MRAIKAHLGDFLWLIGLFVVAIAVTAYIIANQQARGFIPLVQPKPFTLNADFSTGAGRHSGSGTDRARRGRRGRQDHRRHAQERDGPGPARDRAEVREQAARSASDATALLRPKTGLKDMFVELDPGGRGQELKSGDTIPIQNTAPDINPDEILSAFDTDTRQYLQLLINSGGQGLNGRGNDLNETFKALQPTTFDLRRIASAVAERKTELQSLVHTYGDLTNAVADTDGSIKTLVTQADQVFRAFAVAAGEHLAGRLEAAADARHDDEHAQQGAAATRRCSPRRSTRSIRSSSS